MTNWDFNRRRNSYLMILKLQKAIQSRILKSHAFAKNKDDFFKCLNVLNEIFYNKKDYCNYVC